MFALVRSVAPALACACLWSAAAAPSWATAYATRGPVPGAAADTGYVGGAVSEVGLAVSNPGAVTEDFVPGYHVTTRASADNVTGILEGSAAFVLDAATPGALPGAFFDSLVDGQAVLAGGAPGSTVPLTLTLRVHGSFADIAGPHDVGLQAYLWVGAPLAEPSYGSQLEFNLPTGGSAIQTVAIGRAGGWPNSPLYPGAVPSIQSTALGDLRGTAQIRFNATVGQALWVQAAFAGGAGPVLMAGQSQASSASVDGWGTAQLQLVLPAGHSLVDASGALVSPNVVVVATSVPEPASAWLLVGGLIWLAAARRRTQTA